MAERIVVWDQAVGKMENNSVDGNSKVYVNHSGRYRGYRRISKCEYLHMLPVKLVRNRGWPLTYTPKLENYYFWHLLGRIDVNMQIFDRWSVIRAS